MPEAAGVLKYFIYYRDYYDVECGYDVTYELQGGVRTDTNQRENIVDVTNFTTEFPEVVYGFLADRYTASSSYDTHYKNQYYQDYVCLDTEGNLWASYSFDGSRDNSDKNHD